MTSVYLPKQSTPLTTFLLIGTFSILYVLCVVIQRGETGELTLSLSPMLLDKMGGATKYGIFSRSEWYRVFCAPMYHANLMHLFSNCLAIYLCGEFLEPFIQRGWYLFIFFVTALAGVLFGVLFIDTETVTVGASGGIMGLLAAALVLSCRVQERQLKAAIRTRLIGPFASTLLPIVPRLGAWIFGLPLKPDGIDHGAHLGGAIAGLALGLLLVVAWPPFETQPRYERAAGMLTTVYAAATIVALCEGMHIF